MVQQIIAAAQQIVDAAQHIGDAFNLPNPFGAQICGACRPGKISVCEADCQFRHLIPNEQYETFGRVTRTHGGRKTVITWLKMYEGIEEKRQLLNNRAYEANVLREDRMGGCARLIRERDNIIEQTAVIFQQWAHLTGQQSTLTDIMHDLLR